MINVGSRIPGENPANTKTGKPVDSFEKHRMETIYGSLAETLPPGTRPDLEAVRSAAGLATAGANIDLSRSTLPSHITYRPS